MINEDRLVTMETKIFKYLTDSKHEEERILHDLTTSELRLKNQEYRLYKLIKLKTQFYHLNLCLYESKLKTKKQYFNKQ